MVYMYVYAQSKFLMTELISNVLPYDSELTSHRYLCSNWWRLWCTAVGCESAHMCPSV